MDWHQDAAAAVAILVKKIFHCDDDFVLQPL